MLAALMMAPSCEGLVGGVGWGVGFLSKRFLHLDWTHPPTSTIASTRGTGFDGLNLVAREHNMCFSRHACVGVSHQQWI